jgi:hypothetical protein
MQAGLHFYRSAFITFVESQPQSGSVKIVS